MNRVRKVIFLVLAVLVGASGAFSADAAPKPQKPDFAAGNADLQKLIDAFNARRDTILANREALLNQLKNATAEQRKAILEKMQAQQKDLVEAQRALGRQIRDEMRKLPTAPSSTGSGNRR